MFLVITFDDETIVSLFICHADEVKPPAETTTADHGSSSSSTASLVVLLCILLLQCAYTAAFDAPAEGMITHIQRMR